MYIDVQRENLSNDPHFRAGDQSIRSSPRTHGRPLARTSIRVAETDIPLGRRGSAPRLLSAVYSDGKKGGI